MKAHQRGSYSTGQHALCSERQVWALNQLHELGMVLREKGGEGEKEPPAGSTHSTEPDTGLDPTTLRSQPGPKSGPESGVRHSTDEATQVPLRSEFFSLWKKRDEAHRPYDEGESIAQPIRGAQDGQYSEGRPHGQKPHTHHKCYTPEVLVHHRGTPACAQRGAHARQKPVFTGTTGPPHGAPSAGLAPSMG